MALSNNSQINGDTAGHIAAQQYNPRNSDNSTQENLIRQCGSTKNTEGKTPIQCMPEEYKYDLYNQIIERGISTNKHTGELREWMNACPNHAEQEQLFVGVIAHSIATALEHKMDPEKLKTKLSNVLQVVGYERKNADLDAQQLVLQSTKYRDLDFHDKIAKLTIDVRKVWNKIKFYVFKDTQDQSMMDEIVRKAKGHVRLESSSEPSIPARNSGSKSRSGEHMV